MLRNIFIEIEYDGTNYFGWQVQNHQISKSPRHKVTPEGKSSTSYGAGRSQVGEKVRTVQGELEKALRRLFNQEVRVASAGRTDRGVHARGQCASLKVKTKIPLKNIKKALNSFLPGDIRINKIKTVPLDFHARFSAKSKVYRYIIINKRNFSVFIRNYAWHIDEIINLHAIKKAARRIIGKRDFSCFAKQASAYKSCVRILKNISIKKRGSYIYIDIEASGFLRNMARNIVSFLVAVGTGRISQKDIGGIIKGEIRYINNPAPPQGLYLMKIKYE